MFSNRITVLAALLVFSGSCWADGLASIAGRYAYTEYRLTLANGRVLNLADIGADRATLDITGKGSVILRMHMRNGHDVLAEGKVLDVSISGRRGYCVVKWPYMTYSVRAELLVHGDELRSETRFDDRSDAPRYGSVESAVLQRQ
jgi:hypothetical protein